MTSNPQALLEMRGYIGILYSRRAAHNTLSSCRAARAGRGGCERNA